MWETPVRFLGWEEPYRRDRPPTPVFLGFPGDSDGKESTCKAGVLGLITGLGRFPGGGHGHPLQYSSLENLYGQMSLTGYSPRGHKELDMTEQPSTVLSNYHSLFAMTKLLSVNGIMIIPSLCFC